MQIFTPGIAHKKLLSEKILFIPNILANSRLHTTAPAILSSSVKEGSSVFFAHVTCRL